MESGLVRVDAWLKPLSWLYGLGVGLRNMLYDDGVCEVTRFPMPIIGVGNITSGGTGKTPHVEYLIRLLRHRHKVAVLSRGYKRKSRGFRLASLSTPMQEIGDEPWQMRQKFRDIYVAVDANRVRGIRTLLQDPRTKNMDVVILDDAYQHRAVEPGLNILLVDYHRLITDDFLLPAGRLREPVHGKERAHVVVVTKCPKNITPMGYRVIQKSLSLRPFQLLFFSTMVYGKLQGLFVNEERELKNIEPKEHVLLIAGIGSPEQMKKDLDHYSKRIRTLFFPDHHYFSREDIEEMNRAFRRLPEPRLAITTEKDATRLLQTEGLSEELQEALFVLPVKVEIMRGEDEVFNKVINDYVRKSKRNSSVAQ